MSWVEGLRTIQSLPLQLAIAVAWLLFVGAAAALVKRIAPSGTEYVRKVVHIGTGNIILLAWWMNIPSTVILVAGCLFAGISLLSYQVRSNGQQWLPSINQVGRKSYGTFFYAVSIGLLGSAFWLLNRPEFAVIGILVMTWGDGLAGLIGKQWGRNFYEIWGMKKSWEGSIVMAFVSAVTTYCVLATVLSSSPSVIGWIAGVVGVSAAILEAFSTYGVDNLTVPIASSAIAYGLVTFAIASPSL